MNKTNPAEAMTIVLLVMFILFFVGVYVWVFISALKQRRKEEQYFPKARKLSREQRSKLFENAKYN